MDETNPWTSVPDLVLAGSESVEPDIWFLSGMDWRQIDPPERPDSPVPVINLIQHPTHFDPDNPRYEFLANRAIRICISPQVAEAVEATGRVNGPLFVIPDAIDLDRITAAAGAPARDLDFLVAAVKNPELGREVAARLGRGGRSVRLIDEHLTHREEFLQLVARAR